MKYVNELKQDLTLTNRWTDGIFTSARLCYGVCHSGAGYKTVYLLTYCLQHKCSRNILVSGIMIFRTADTHFAPNFPENWPTSIFSSFDLCNIARPSPLTFQVHHWKYTVSNTTALFYTVYIWSATNSLTYRQQLMLSVLLLECMTSDVHAAACSPLNVLVKLLRDIRQKPVLTYAISVYSVWIWWNRGIII